MPVNIMKLASRFLRAAHWPPLRGVAITALALAAFVLPPAGPALAAGGLCEPAQDGPGVVAAPTDQRAASLSRPFQIQNWPVDRASILYDAQRRAADQLARHDAPGCYAALLPNIAARTAFLSPYEFLVAGYYDHDWDTRNALLQLYRDNPQQAERRLSGIWPSPRSEMLIRTFGYFDLDTNQIYVNIGAVPPELATNVVVHEFWHALANVHEGRQADGTISRTTGFWTEVRAPDGTAWRPLEEQVDGVPTFLMNEALAIEMEVTATGREHPDMRPDLVEAVDTLHDLFDWFGRPRVVRLYLESQSDELKMLAQQVASSRETIRTASGSDRAAYSGKLPKQ